MSKNGKIKKQDVAFTFMLSQNGGNKMECAAGFSIHDPLFKSMERWLYRFKQNSVRTSTFNRLLTSFNAMRDYNIAYMRVEDLTTDNVQSYINKLLSDGYAYTTIKKQFNLISAFVKFLLGEGLSIRPVHLNVVLPAEANIRKPKRDIEAYEEPEQKRLRKTCEEVDNMAAHAVLILLETGMRIGELLALQWSDILWSRRAVRIHGTLVNPVSRKRSYVQDSAKSKTSNRTIPLSAKALAVFKDMYEDAPFEDGLEDKLVFSSKNDPKRSIAYNPLARDVKELCSIAKIKWKGFHVFRHTFATNCYYKGCDIKKLSKLLGHANVTITYNIYINLYGDCLEELREIVN